MTHQRFATTLLLAGSLAFALGCANEDPEQRPTTGFPGGTGGTGGTGGGTGGTGGTGGFDAGGASDAAPLDTVTADVSAPDAGSGGGWSAGPDIPVVECVGEGPSGGASIREASIDNDFLIMIVAYAGGCAEHRFRTCWDGAFVGPEPLQAVLGLQHDAGGDSCETRVTETLRVRLAWIRDTWLAAFGGQTGSVVIALDERRLVYEFDACSGLELPPCPPECPEGAFERCGAECDIETDEACGNEIGDSMECLEGLWACNVHAPLGTGCNLVCER